MCFDKCEVSNFYEPDTRVKSALSSAQILASGFGETTAEEFSLSTTPSHRMGNALNHRANKNEPTGFQVTTVQPLSPGADCGLKCNEDFIIKLNGKTVSATDPNLIMGLVQNSVNRPVTLQVYSTKTQKVREVKLTPSSNWPGEGLLGITMKLSKYKAPPKPKSPKSVKVAYT